MQEYVCHYLTDATHSARAVYHASTIADAMAMHNSALPEFKEKVLKWDGPTGITFLLHDSALTLDEPEPAPQSGYTHCACRDCMEIFVANNTARPELCDGCNVAGCGDPDATTWPECQRDDTYEG